MAKKSQTNPGEKNICVNRRARFEYHIVDKHEAGIMLYVPEVKSLRDGRDYLQDSYARVNKGEAFLINAHISNYEAAHHFQTDPTRSRKLLLHKKEIMRLMGRVREQGLTLVPLRLYFKEGKAKVELALAKGKKLYDKRATTREREVKRDLARAMRREDR
jgi:SsrA-binding protein